MCFDVALPQEHALLGGALFFAAGSVPCTQSNLGRTESEYMDEWFEYQFKAIDKLVMNGFLNKRIFKECLGAVQSAPLQAPQGGSH
jgi:hypothetical protein